MQALVSTTDSVDAFSLLQNMAPMSYDSSRLIDVACISFSTTDHAHLAALQARHRQTVLAQFAVRPRILLFVTEVLRRCGLLSVYQGAVLAIIVVILQGWSINSFILQVQRSVP